MREIIRLFAQIAVLRRGPQDLPASLLLLVLTVVGYLGVNFLVRSALPPDDHWRGPLLADTVFMLVWYVALLKLLGRPERILQTVTAVFGLQSVLAPLVIASEWLMRRFGQDDTWQTAVTCLGLLLFAWLIAANSHVVKAALEWSGSASVALVILQMLAGWLVVFALFAPVKA
ncbi:MAG TPA: hypothetical protein VGP32_13580 [Steroidobacteraceae bacterium]|jgi:hypothetical protein|nr:hypothetical protein [Steroidobacteraceae bacterium]